MGNLREYCRKRLLQASLERLNTDQSLTQFLEKASCGKAGDTIIEFAIENLESGILLPCLKKCAINSEFSISLYFTAIEKNLEYEEMNEFFLNYIRTESNHSLRPKIIKQASDILSRRIRLLQVKEESNPDITKWQKMFGDFLVVCYEHIRSEKETYKIANIILKTKNIERVPLIKRCFSALQSFKIMLPILATSLKLIESEEDFKSILNGCLDCYDLKAILTAIEYLCLFRLVYKVENGQRIASVYKICMARMMKNGVRDMGEYVAFYSKIPNIKNKELITECTLILSEIIDEVGELVK